MARTPSRPRRSGGTGTVAPDPKTGGWKARITLPKKPGEAKAKRPWVPIPGSVGMSEPMAQEKAAVYTKKAKKGDGTFTAKRGADLQRPAATTIADLCTEWLKLIAADPKLTPATRAQHKSSVELVIKPKLGNVVPSALSMPALRQWIRDLAAEFAPSTVRNRFNSLSKMLTLAQARQVASALAAWECTGRARLPERVDDPIFPCATAKGGATLGGAYRPRSAELIRDDLKAAGLTKDYKPDVPFTMTSLRHSFATWLAAADIPETTRQRLMGHARSGVTERHHTAADLESLSRAVEAIRLDVGGGGRHDSGPPDPGGSSKLSSQKSSQDGVGAEADSENRKQHQQLAPVAQWIEQRFPKPKVARPIRAGGAQFRRIPKARITPAATAGSQGR